jgi:hypothetical protein
MMLVPAAHEPPATFQTVRLSVGHHRCAEDGVCVMELASMLAGDPFSDRPPSVCRVIAALLRSYNDRAGTRRQDLYGYAAAVVGTAGSTMVERRRVDHCLSELAAQEAQMRWAGMRRILRHPVTVARLGKLLADDPMSGSALDELGLGMVWALGAGRAGTHRRVLALIDQLIAIGPPQAPAAVAAASLDTAGSTTGR